MTREEKLKLFKEKGWTYNKETGEIFSHTGRVVKAECYGYIRCSLRVEGKIDILVSGHQLAWYITTGEVADIIDHINRVKDDNRILNLRSVTQKENRFNTPSKGYYKTKDRYMATIRLNGKNKHLGCYDNEADAHQAYLDAKKIYHII